MWSCAEGKVPYHGKQDADQNLSEKLRQALRGVVFIHVHCWAHPCAPAGLARKFAPGALVVFLVRRIAGLVVS